MARDASNLAWDQEENAESFLREAVKCVESGQGHDWIFAVTSLATALELCLKAILRNEHWSLLFEEVGLASEEALRSGKFKSVGFQEALDDVRRSQASTLKRKTSATEVETAVGPIASSVTSQR